MIDNKDEINHFIYNKIENYNKKFEEFKKFRFTRSKN